MPSSRHAFTLLELCLALAIGVMLILLAVPSIAGMLAEQRLQITFARFDQLAAEARRRSVVERRAHLLVWEKTGIFLRTSGANAADRGATGAAQMLLAEDESCGLRRPAALTESPRAEWIFWPNGTCEPAEISFRSPAGSWLAVYDPLTGHGTFSESAVP